MESSKSMDSSERGYRKIEFSTSQCRMEQGSRRKRIIALSAPESEDEKGFAGILSSISKAQQQRQLLKQEFRRSNTFQYCLMEAGAETFELSLVYFRKVIGIIGLVRTVVVERLPIFKSIPQIKVNQDEDMKIVELKLELLRLKEEMQKLSKSSVSNDTLKRGVQPVDDSAQEVSRQPPRALPFNADMLKSAKAQQKTPVKINDRSVAVRIPNGKRADEPKSIQEVLQKALEEKFKNVRQMENDDLDSSFDADTTPCRQTVKAKPNAASKVTKAGKEQISDNKAGIDPTETENNLNAKPPIPPRPKRGDVANPKRILTEHNSS